MDKREWLEADGLGGYASGTVSGVRTRRYHALLLTATTPPTGRMVLVNGFDAWVKTAAGTYGLSSQRYAPDAIHPDGAWRLEAFEAEPWPQWTFHLEDGTRVRQELFVPHGLPAVVLSWRLLEWRPDVTLWVRPFLSGRDYHHLHHENPSFRFAPQVSAGRIAWHPYPGVPGVVALTTGHYTQEGVWFRNFLYEEEQARGLDYIEDLASPGFFRWDLSRGEAGCVLVVEDRAEELLPPGLTAEACLLGLRDAEQRRRQRFPSARDRAADAYLVRRNHGLTVVAGYPWFTDWGRDTCISLRGLCLATGRLDEARRILLEWGRTVSEGMLPNRFPDQGQTPEYNSVDASLWYIVAVHEFLTAWEGHREPLDRQDRQTLESTVEAILSGYARGTRHGIRLDSDGLLAAGEPGVALTWMDVKIDGQPVTPRSGKPVEVQALWLNALHAAGRFSNRWAEHLRRGLAAFANRFWNEEEGYLYDVVDVDHQAEQVDAACRPNQVLAVGGLPLPLLQGERARQVVDAVEAQLWTPLGLRTLAPNEPGYCPHCRGGVVERDRAYHQGTVWPWLLGPFVEAWVRVRGDTPEARQEARQRFLEPLSRHFQEAGIGHLSEIADGDEPHTPRGCPFQAWSLAEFLRLDRVVLAEEEKSATTSSVPPANNGVEYPGPPPVLLPSGRPADINR